MLYILHMQFTNGIPFSLLALLLFFITPGNRVYRAILHKAEASDERVNPPLSSVTASLINIRFFHIQETCLPVFIIIVPEPFFMQLASYRITSLFHSSGKPSFLSLFMLLRKLTLMPEVCLSKVTNSCTYHGHHTPKVST